MHCTANYTIHIYFLRTSTQNCQHRMHKTYIQLWLQKPHLIIYTVYTLIFTGFVAFPFAQISHFHIRGCWTKGCWNIRGYTECFHILYLVVLYCKWRCNFAGFVDYVSSGELHPWISCLQGGLDATSWRKACLHLRTMLSFNSKPCFVLKCHKAAAMPFGAAYLAIIAFWVVVIVLFFYVDPLCSAVAWRVVRSSSFWAAMAIKKETTFYKSGTLLGLGTK